MLGSHGPSGAQPIAGAARAHQRALQRHGRKRGRRHSPSGLREWPPLVAARQSWAAYFPRRVLSAGQPEPYHDGKVLALMLSSPHNNDGPSAPTPRRRRLEMLASH